MLGRCGVVGCFPVIAGTSSLAIVARICGVIGGVGIGEPPTIRFAMEGTEGTDFQGELPVRRGEVPSVRVVDEGLRWGARQLAASDAAGCRGTEGRGADAAVSAMITFMSTLSARQHCSADAPQRYVLRSSAWHLPPARLRLARRAERLW